LISVAISVETTVGIEFIKVASVISVVDIGVSTVDSEIGKELSKSVGAVLVAYENVGIDGPILSELFDISVVEMSMRVDVNSDENEAVFIVVDGVVSLGSTKSVEMPVVLDVSMVAVESNKFVNGSVVFVIIDSVVEGVNDVD
jgi:hypothetical protein